MSFTAITPFCGNGSPALRKKEMLLSKVDHKTLWNIEEEREGEGKGD